MPDLSDEDREDLQRLQQAAEERERVLREHPERTQPSPRPEKWAEPILVDKQGRWLPRIPDWLRLRRKQRSMGGPGS